MAVNSAAAFSRSPPLLGTELLDEGGQAVGCDLALGAEPEELKQAGPVHGQAGRLHGEFVGQDVVVVAGHGRPRRRQQQAGPAKHRNK